MVVAETQCPQLTVVFRDGLAQRNDAGVIFVVGVPGDEAAVQLDDSRKRELLGRRLVEAAGSLDELLIC